MISPAARDVLTALRRGASLVVCNDPFRSAFVRTTDGAGDVEVLAHVVAGLMDAGRVEAERVDERGRTFYWRVEARRRSGER